MEGRVLIHAGARAVAALLAVVVVAWLVLLIVNWRDEPPSVEAQRLAAMIRDRAPMDDAANGYVHVLGLAAARGADPVALGSRRRAWLEQFAERHVDGVGYDFPGQDANYRAVRSGDVAALAEACSIAASCLDALAATPGAFAEWRAAEHWLLDRYVRMLAVEGWQETPPADLRAPMAGYQHAIDVQKLYLLDVHQRAVAQDAATVRGLLERDLAFWRNVLASSDLLISKMIAVEAVKRNLAFGSLALRQLPPELVDAAVPASWRHPLSDAERSVMRPIAGEWHLVGSTLSASLSSGGFDPGAKGGPGVAGRVLRPLLQPQATLNLGAARMVRWGEASRRPYAAIGGALEHEALAAGQAPRFRGLYNPVGTLLDSLGATDSYGDYIARTSDLEGLRRAALLVATLRARGVGGAGTAQAVRDAPLRNPYDGAPFGWDASEGSVVVLGLAHGDRRRHAFKL